MTTDEIVQGKHMVEVVGEICGGKYAMHCGLFASSLCGCVPFLFPAQAPSVAVFPS